MKSHPSVLFTLCLIGGAWFSYPQAVQSENQSPVNHQQVSGSLRKAVAFFQQQVSIQGGYLWRYSSDLKKREGEGKASETTAWVQPPGTPSVGEALLRVYHRTENRFYRDAARQTALALVQGQLRSGGWDYRIEFNPKQRNKYAYRTDGKRSGTRNTTTLDDNTTQSALRFLMHIDRTLEFKDPQIHQAVRYCLKSLLEVQYPNGAWPQRFSEYPDPDKFPVRKANYPPTWSRTYPEKDYRTYYTFNDNTMADVIDVMFEATAIYNDARYRQAAEKCGDFILLAQMPAPQPAWAQQYNAACQPAWARKFEPASVTGGESQGIMRTLLKLYRKTGKTKYLEAVEPALKYLEASRLPDGKLARFYELKTNKPLYFTKKYDLTYQANDLPTHYGFIVGSKLETIRKNFERLRKQGPDQLGKPKPENFRSERLTSSLQQQAAKIVAAQDRRGAWVDQQPLRYQGSNDSTKQTINCSTFISNIDLLSRYLAATRK
ncbi:MAG TPA: polysaccharide lyase [Planctomycetes bacterium]|nr:polysaccharide lyase [Planctomycetaceae bacterium]HIN94220.1 polysaccharide lyase [Planctomycetota bacterium]